MRLDDLQTHADPSPLQQRDVSCRPGGDDGSADARASSRRCEHCHGPIPPEMRKDSKFCRETHRKAAHKKARRALAREGRPVAVPARIERVPKVIPLPVVRFCAYCDRELPAGMRKDAEFCNDSHRQAQHRITKVLRRRMRCSKPLRWAYADPPYKGKAHLYKGHPDFAGEVDLDALAVRLLAYDGWAFSMSAEGRAATEAALLRAGHTDVRVAIWVRGSRASKTSGSTHPLSAYEVVFYCGWRDEPTTDRPDDVLVLGVAPRMTDPRRVIGAKPAGFVAWMFELLGALPGDGLDDLFPGSGIVSRAWKLYNDMAIDGEAPRALPLEALEEAHAGACE